MITVFNLMLAFAGCALAVAAVPASSGPVWLEREAFLMGTVLRARVAAADRATGAESLEAAFAEIRRLEGVLSAWTPESEIGRLNGSPADVSVQLSSELMTLLAEADRWSRSTEGAFDPAVGALIDAWDLRGEGRRPSTAEVAAALRASGMEHFRLDLPGSSVVRGAPGAWLDTGAFGKGAALRSAERVLRDRGTDAAMLDFGGQVLAYGESPTPGGEWEIAVAHPSNRHAVAATLRLRSGSVATTAQSERYVDVNAERYGHVLDPRTGHPVPAWGSVTVVAADPVVADILSTALFVMGPEAGQRWAAGRGEGILFLKLDEGAVVASWNEAFEQNRIDNQTTSEYDDRK